MSLYLHLCGSAMPCLLVGTAQDRPKCHGDVDVPQPKEGVLEIRLSEKVDIFSWGQAARFLTAGVARYW